MSNMFENFGRLGHGSRPQLDRIWGNGLGTVTHFRFISYGILSARKMHWGVRPDLSIFQVQRSMVKVTAGAKLIWAQRAKMQF